MNAQQPHASTMENVQITEEVTHVNVQKDSEETDAKKVSQFCAIHDVLTLFLTPLEL